MIVHHRLRNIKRLRQITNAFVKAELGYVIAKLKLKSHLSLRKKLQHKEFEKPLESLPQRLRIVFEDLGGSFVKLGQLLSLRYDLLPEEYCEEFSKLQDNVRPISFASVKKVIEKELGPMDKVFKTFNKEPVAAASVGQVHKAMLKNGKVVAVKVQRPNIEEVFKTDIDIYYYLADLLHKHFPELRQYDPKGIVEGFEKYTIKELDYKIEAKNIDGFYENFKNCDYVTIPEVYWKYTTKRVLVMEFIEGKKISEVKQFTKLHSNKKKVVENVLEAVTTQILEHQFFHADPHPGNILLIRNNKIAFLDFGIVGRITDDMIYDIENFIIGAINRDPDMIIRSMIQSGSLDHDIDMKAFKADMVDAAADYYDVSLKQINIAGMFLSTFKLARKYHIKLPMNYTLLGKSLITLQGFSTKFYPEFNWIQFMKPKVTSLLKKRFGPTHMLSSVRDTAMDFKDLVRNLPSDIGALVRAIKYGAKINIDVDQKDMRYFTLELDRSSNRLTFGIILAALIIAATMILNMDLKPMIYGIPFLVYILLIFIIILTVSLMSSILREGKGGEEE